MRVVFLIALGLLALYVWRRAAAENRARDAELYRRAAEARARDRRERYRFN